MPTGDERTPAPTPPTTGSGIYRQVVTVPAGTVTVEEWRRLEALKAAATACAGDTALSEQQIVKVAKVFEAYLKGGETV